MPNEVQCVGIAAFRGDTVLLINHKKRYGASLPGGKKEPGESDEDAVRRECLEETHLRVTKVGPMIFEDEGGSYVCRVYSVEVEEGEPVGGDDAEKAWFGELSEILMGPCPQDFYPVRHFHEGNK